MDAFLHAENRAGLRFLQARGFPLGPLTHIYVLAPRMPAQPPIPSARRCAPRTRSPSRGCTRTLSPPGRAPGGRPARRARRGTRHLRRHRGLRLLGYVCVSVNRAPREGFIDYLAVKPVARGQGIGARLLQTALRWTFEDRRLPQAALCVSEWRGGARRLYEQAGFTLSASGIGARRGLRQERIRLRTPS